MAFGRGSFVVFATQDDTVAAYGLSIANAFIRDSNVDGLISSSSAAPPLPEIFQFAWRRALRRLRRSCSRQADSGITAPRVKSSAPAG